MDVAWAGRVGRGVWIEAFSILPLETLQPSDIEYKGLTANGFETPWLSNNQVCGTRGMGISLVGFAVRLKSSPGSVLYQCEYFGQFQSGIMVGPCRNGAPCRSTDEGDSLECIQVRITKSAAILSGAECKADAVALGPQFSKFREELEDEGVLEIRPVDSF